MKTVVVALGGNAILPAGKAGTIKQQTSAVKKTVKTISKLIKQGWRVVITHGNGPQVGNIMIQQEKGKKVVPMMPLDICDAQTQGLIGYLIQRELENQLKKDKIKKEVVTFITQILVDGKDRAFKDPTKPIGPFYSDKEVKKLKKKFKMIKQKGKGWRRVVPSPKPKKILEVDEIKYLVSKGRVVIACGGGGIPVVKRRGLHIGVEAVIDKDRAAQLLASELKADLLLILTDVDCVYLNYKTRKQKKLVWIL